MPALTLGRLGNRLGPLVREAAKHFAIMYFCRLIRTSRAARQVTIHFLDLIIQYLLKPLGPASFYQGCGRREHCFQFQTWTHRITAADGLLPGIYPSAAYCNGGSGYETISSTAWGGGAAKTLITPALNWIKTALFLTTKFVWCQWGAEEHTELHAS